MPGDFQNAKFAQFGLEKRHLATLIFFCPFGGEFDPATADAAGP
jgi:hypothetical protein